MEITWRIISGEREGENGRGSTGNKKYKWQAQNRQGEVKNSIGNLEVKELIYTTHRHELTGASECGWDRVCRVERNKGGKWENCNSIINKIC